MADVRKRGHYPTNPGDLVLGHLPDHHGVPLETGPLMTQNCPKAPDHSPANQIMNSFQKFFFLQAELPGQGFEWGRRDGEISLNLADQFFIICCQLNRIHEATVINMIDVYDL